MRKLLPLILALILVSQLSKAQEITRLSLRDCLKYAEENNLTLKNAELSKATTEINYQQAKNQMLPSVSASASQGFGYSHGSNSFNINGNYGINAGVTIFNGLSIQNSIKQQELYLKQADLQIEEYKNSVNLQIVQSFLTILMNQELLGFEERLLETSREQMLQGEQQFRVGQILESDFMLLQAQYASDSLNIENTKFTIENNLLALKNILSIDSRQQIDIIKPDSASLSEVAILPSIDDVCQKMLDYYPSLKLQESNIEAAEYDIKIAKSSYYPTLSASAGISTGYTNNNEGAKQLGNNLGENIGLSLNIPIYNRSNTKSQVKISQIKLEQQKIQQEQKQLELIQEVEKQYIQTQQSLNKYQVSEIKRDAYYASFLAYNYKFNHGAITAVELLQQQSNYLNCLNDYLQNKYSYILYRKVLDVYMGVQIEL